MHPLPGPHVRSAADRRVANWLFACAALACTVLVVGGITRLTHSGLSIARWQPLAGALPPLSEQDWGVLFGQYRETPEYRLVNPGMSLAQFHSIFWWEYAHRLLARVAGLVFVLPLLWFLRAGLITRRLAWRLWPILALGALQGALGWFMVASGLVDDPRVSPLRLAAHLGLGLLLIGALLWNAWSLRFGEVQAKRVPAAAALAAAAVFVMALTGAIVAGTRAGFAFATFPLMDGSLVPPGLLRLAPWYENLLYNPATVQFVHRAFAVAVMVMVLLSARAAWTRRVRGAGRAALLLLAALGIQLSLGIATLLSGVALPIAASHQAGAVALFGCALWNAFMCARGAGRGASDREAQARSSESAMAAPISTAR